MSTQKVAFAAIFIAGGLVGSLPLFFRDRPALIAGSSPSSLAVGAAGPGSASASIVAESLGSFGKGSLTRGDLTSDEKYKLYEAERKVFDTVQELLLQRYVEGFFEDYQKEHKLGSVQEAQTKYMAENANVTDAEVNAFLQENAANPGLQKVPEDQRVEQVRRYLEGQSRSGAIRALAATARTSGQIIPAVVPPVEPRVEVGADGNEIFGNPNAKVSIIEFADYQCPFCARMVPTLKEVIKKYDGKVNWVYRDFPLDFHPEATPAAIAANCSGQQGKYYEMHNRLFEELRNLGPDLYPKLAGELGLEMAKFNECLKDPAQREEVMRDQSVGAAIGVNGTPAYFINGRRISGGVDIAELSRIIEEELAAVN
jgi:protein-disulfide isomerase